MSTPPRRRVLILSWIFPPSQSIGAIRVSKFARYLRDFGWDTRVVTAAPDLLPFPQTLPPEIPAGDTHQVRFFDPLMAAGNWKRRRATSTADARASLSHVPGSTGASSAADRLLRLLLRAIPVDNQVRLPDRSLFWWPTALRHARVLAQHWHPHAILSSHGPPGSHIVASRLSREFGIPWVADYRDPWSGHYGHRYPRVLDRLEARIERAVLRPAAAITTVSEQLADHFTALHGKPVTTIYNGFDDEDYAVPQSPGEDFVIVYTGIAEAPHRDPEPLFAAVAQLRREGAEVLPRLHFIGNTKPAFLHTLATQYGILDLLTVEPNVPRSRSIELQRLASVLLVLNWGAQKGGMLSGKLMEYLGARRPILAIGPRDHGVSEILERTRAGVWAGSAGDIAQILRTWTAEHARAGSVPVAVDETELSAFSRRTQAGRLAAVLDAVVSAAP